MSRTALLLRVFICIALLLVHYLVIFVPVSEFFLIYVLLCNPRWFRDFLYRSARESQGEGRSH